MALLAVSQEPALEVSPIELERTGPSYTIDTVRAFLAASPGARIYFVIGADTLPELKTWKDARTLLSLATFAAAARPGYGDYDREAREVEKDLGGAVVRIPIEPDDVSATAIRARVREGKP